MKKSELLILCAGNRYVRVIGDDYELCSMEKASVFPVERYHQVRKQKDDLTARGLKDLLIHKLTIVEEPYQEE